MNATSDQLAKEKLTQYMDNLLKKNKNLHVFSAQLHMDKEVLHLHIDFIYHIQPVANED